MYSKPTMPKTIGGVLDDAFGLYRASLPRSWPLALVPEVLRALIYIGLMSRLELRAPADPRAMFALLESPVFALSAIFGFLVMFTFNLALIDHVNAIATQRPASLMRSLGTGLRLLPRAVGALLLVAIATAAGFVLLVLPGIYLAGSWMLTFAAMIVADTGAVESMRLSGRLVKGHWWRTTTAYTAAILVALALFVAVSLLFEPWGAPGGALLIGLQRLVSVALGTLISVWFPVVLLSLYYDLSLRREGADLARRVEELRPQ